MQAQEKLAHSSVLVVGAGGLGCPALQYMAAAGIGRLGIVDGDSISLSNLHRQILFGEADLGKSKAVVAAERLTLLNSAMHLDVYHQMLDHGACLQLFPQYDIVMDCTDNFATRYMINDACVLLQKPLIWGAVSQYQGQVATFNVAADNGLRSCNYRHLFAQPPLEQEVANCAEGGVLGMLPGVVGSMMALELVKLVTGVGRPTLNAITTWDALHNVYMTFDIDASTDLAACLPKDTDAFMQTDYQYLCGTRQLSENEIDIETLDAADEFLLVDVRGLDEMPAIDSHRCVRIPLPGLHDQLPNLKDQKVVFICQSGKRSLQAVDAMKVQFPSAVCYSLRGGVNGLIENNKMILQYE